MQSPNNGLPLYATTFNNKGVGRRRTVQCSKQPALTVTTCFNNYKLQEECVLNLIGTAGNHLQWYFIV